MSRFTLATLSRLVSITMVVCGLTVGSRASDFDDGWFKGVEASYAARLAELRMRHERQVSDLLENMKKAAWTAETFEVRAYLKKFQTTKEVTFDDIAQAPKELKFLQRTYLDDVEKAADEILGNAHREVDRRATELTARGESQAALALQDRIEELEARFGFSGMALASSLPKEVTITSKFSWPATVGGHAVVDIELNPGETYKTRRASEYGIVIDVGGDAVIMPVADTDVAARVAAAKKGIPYSPDVTGLAESLNSEANTIQTNTNSSSFNPRAWKIVRPLPGADVSFYGDHVEFHSRGTVVSAADIKAVTLELSGQFKTQADVLAVYLRADERCSNPFGAPDGGVVIQVDLPGSSLLAFTWNFKGDGRQDLAAAPLGFSMGRTFTLKIVDDGSTIRVYLDDLVKPRLEFSTSRSFGKKVIVHNRETGNIFEATILKISPDLRR